MLTFRDTIRKIVPRWLQTGTAYSVLYAVASQADVLTEILTAGVKVRFPGLYSDESLPLIGRERRIFRGPLESAESYAVRLRRWLDDHATRGGPYAMLAQLYAYYDGNHFPIRLIYRSGRYFDMDAEGAITMGYNAAWNPDETPEKWARWRLIYEWPDPIPAAHELGEPGLVLGSFVLGSGLSLEEVAAIRLVPREWNAAHAQGQIQLVNGGWVLGVPPHLLGEPGLVLGGTTTTTLGV